MINRITYTKRNEIRQQALTERWAMDAAYVEDMENWNQLQAESAQASSQPRIISHNTPLHSTAKQEVRCG